MAPAVRQYFQEGLAASTRRTYDAAMRKFYAFCTLSHIHTPFPIMEHILCSFAAHIADQGLAPQTIKGYLLAIRTTQISLGFPASREQSSLPLLKRVQAGIQRVRSRDGPPSRLRLPITAAIMDRIRTHLERSDLSHKQLLWAICCTAFFGFFRLGKLLSESRAQANAAASLTWGDVAVDSRERPTMHEDSPQAVKV